ncbi:hypothetical protein T458_05685 [Brevibacillus panacihumi W25]|uniref:Uncharacterized protein n=1 Tax=Brevibacillus panacihumi W25 TaxID=1408254 RepID=V6MAQ4_9BACL|nr:hypothetical protein T458_05685 [Brevibacillus panacihumi W25]
MPVSYEATWLLPRLDFHQLAINGLLGALAAEYVFRLFRSSSVKIPNAFSLFPFFLDQLFLVPLLPLWAVSRRLFPHLISFFWNEKTVWRCINQTISE